MEAGEQTQESGHSAAQRRAEARRRKLLNNSELRMSRITGFSRSDAERKPLLHLDLDPPELYSSSSSSSSVKASPLFSQTTVSDPLQTNTDRSHPDSIHGLDSFPPESSSPPLHAPPQGRLMRPLSHLQEALNLRGALSSPRPVPQEGTTESESLELEGFALFRLVMSAALAVIVRLFFCQYLSIFAPFLTLELGFMGLQKYFPQSSHQGGSSVLSAALLLSGVPADLIQRSTHTYRSMRSVFCDLCVYFFSFILTHQLIA